MEKGKLKSALQKEKRKTEKGGENHHRTLKVFHFREKLGEEEKSK